MKPRYFVAIPIPTTISTKIKKFYFQNFNSEILIKNLHISLISPFFIKDEYSEAEIIQKIKEIKFNKFVAQITKSGIFKQKGNQILYAKVEPTQKISDLSNIINKTLIDIVNIDLSPYTNNQLPSFISHITLSYDFKEKTIPKLPIMTFSVKKITLFKQEVDWVVLV